MSIEQTSTGVRKNYGPRTDEDKAPAKHNSAGAVKELVVDFNYDDLPGNDQNDNLILDIPADSLVVDAYGYVTEAFNSTSGTTTVDVGLVDFDGGANDPDGLIATFVTADGSSEPAGTWVVGAGALVGASVTEEDQQVVVTPSVADLTAGSARVIVRYIDPKA